MNEDILRLVQQKIDTDECRERRRYFEDLKQRFLLLGNQHAQRFCELNETVDQFVSHIQYAKGGKTIHRGYYSPSHLDMVVGGMSRGKLLRRKTGNYDYSYHFDADGRLLRVQKMDGEILEVEVLQYCGGRVRSFAYNMWRCPILHFISECIYNEAKQMTHYITALYNADENAPCVTEINVECYSYGDDGLVSDLVWERCVFSIGLTNKSIYSFERDEEGKIAAYTVENCDGREKRKFCK